AGPVTMTQVGTYTWHAHLAGDINNNPDDDDGVNETAVTIKASPVITTNASQVGNVVGTATTSDTATVTGGDAPSGAITFTLTTPGGVTSSVPTNTGGT